MRQSIGNVVATSAEFVAETAHEMAIFRLSPLRPGRPECAKNNRPVDRLNPGFVTGIAFEPAGQSVPTRRNPQPRICRARRDMAGNRVFMR